jgi:hypothetical protein
MRSQVHLSLIGTMLRALLLLTIAACNPQQPRSGVDTKARAFELVCTGSATHTSGSIQCVRLDTRTGDVQRVDLSKLPVSFGPTGAAPGAEGLFQLSCAAVNMAERSDFSCVRLNTQSGELLLVNLQKVGQVP